jgi:hypothetical protein
MYPNPAMGAPTFLEDQKWTKLINAENEASKSQGFISMVGKTAGAYLQGSTWL